MTYCHELPGLIAFKKLLENIEDSEDLTNVIGIDDGKNILKIVWNWSLMLKCDKGERKYMGPKRSIILAAVMNVKETHHNMSVLMELTKINEVEYALSLDLKLVNITLGLCTHSSKHPCPYGECFRNEYGNWVKGRDGTIGNIKEHRAKWMERSRNKEGNRKKIKEHMNCEYEPLINGYPEDSMINTIPPPPLHTILLGPVNHIMKELFKRHPNTLRLSTSRAPSTMAGFLKVNIKAIP